MQTILHKNDLADGVEFSDLIAADCEMMGLQPDRDPLCLIQLYDGQGDCHLAVSYTHLTLPTILLV